MIEPIDGMIIRFLNIDSREDAEKCLARLKKNAYAEEGEVRNFSMCLGRDGKTWEKREGFSVWLLVGDPHWEFLKKIRNKQ